MFKIYRDASTRYLAVNLTKWYGAKFEPCRDGAGRAGLYVLWWKPRDQMHLTYGSFWIPFPRFV